MLQLSPYSRAVALRGLKLASRAAALRELKLASRAFARRNIRGAHGRALEPDRRILE